MFIDLDCGQNSNIIFKYTKIDENSKKMSVYSNIMRTSKTENSTKRT